MEDIAAVKACEEALRTAMLAGDVDALSALIDDRLVFTGPDGRVLSKADDLAAHRSGLIKIHRMDVSTAGIHRIDPMILTTTMVALSGTFAGQPIAGSFAYTRLWTRSGTTCRRDPLIRRDAMRFGHSRARGAQSQKTQGRQCCIVATPGEGMHPGEAAPIGA